MRQETLTVVARVKDVPRLRRTLKQLREARVGGSASNYFQPRIFAEPELGIHFARMVVIPNDAQGRFADWLVFESNFDTPHAETAPARERHLERLCEREHALLSEVYAACQDSPRDAPAELAGYLKERLVAATASYQGHTQRDLARIRLEQRIRESVLAFLETAPKATKAELYRLIRDHLRKQSKLDPALAGFNVDAAPPDLPSAALRSKRLREGVLPWIENAGPALPILAHVPQILAWQRHDAEFDLRARQENQTDAERRFNVEIAATEDYGAQNALTHVVALRGGEGRAKVLAAAHAYIDRMAKAFFDDIGQLGGIPSIHFAKWLLLDEGKRLLFFSNYDSSWESYLGDFVDQAALGLNLAWSCTEEYPKTNLLGFEGAKDEERFKAWGRAYQQPTDVFYSAYPELSIATINNNTWIRHGLQARPSTADANAWFRRLT